MTSRIKRSTCASCSQGIKRAGSFIDVSLQVQVPPGATRKGVITPTTPSGLRTVRLTGSKLSVAWDLGAVEKEPGTGTTLLQVIGR